jgi:hypothetical protein
MTIFYLRSLRSLLLLLVLEHRILKAKEKMSSPHRREST